MWIPGVTHMPTLWWLVLTLILLVIEMITPGLFFFACLATGSLLAALAAWLGVNPLTSWLVFFGSSAVLIMTIAPLARRWMKSIPRSPVGLDSLAGQRARVTEAVDPNAGKGQVRLEGGALWRATSEGPIPIDTWVHVVGVVGTRLRVRKQSDEPDS